MKIKHIKIILRTLCISIVWSKSGNEYKKYLKKKNKLKH